MRLHFRYIVALEACHLGRQLTLSYISLLYPQGADGVRGLKGHKGDKVILGCVCVRVLVLFLASV